MKKSIYLLSLVFAGTLNASVINFDDLSTGPLTGSYGGLNWGSNWNVFSNSSYSGYGNTYGSTSGENAAFNSGGALNISLSSGLDFDFNGAYFTGWASNDSFAGYTATSITINGFNNGSLVGSATMNLSANQYDWLQADLLNVDELQFVSSRSSNWWLMDDLTINAASIPEPAPLALLALGLAGLGLSKRKKTA